MARADKQISLKTLHVDTNGVDLAKGLPERLKILDWGVNKSNQGDVIVNDTTVSIFEGNQHRLGRETVAIDFNHCTVEGTEAFKNQKGMDIGGYGRPVVIKGEGVYLESVSTTPTGISKAPDFKDLSPAVLVDEKTGTLVGLHSVALTPTGSVYGLTIESAALKAMSAVFKTLNVSLLDTKTNSTPAAYRNGVLNDSDIQSTIMISDDQMNSMRTALGMPADADWDKIFPMVLAKMGSGKQGPITPNDKNQYVSQPSGFSYTVMAAELKKDLDIEGIMKPLTAKIEALETQVATTRKAGETNEKNEIIANATKEGKVLTLSAAALEGIPVAALKEIVAGLPKAQLATKANMKVLGAKPEKARTMSDAAEAFNRQVESAAPGALRTQLN